MGGEIIDDKTALTAVMHIVRLFDDIQSPFNFLYRVYKNMQMKIYVIPIYNETINGFHK